jgi:hypothetical protein
MVRSRWEQDAGIAWQGCSERAEAITAVQNAKA